jgi:hypothetical protein
MKFFNYKIIRYMPSVYAGEFSNVGLLAVSSENNEIKIFWKNRFTRENSFFDHSFSEVKLEVVSYLNKLKKRCDQFNKSRKSDFLPLEIIEAFTAENDSCITFSKKKTSLYEGSFQIAFEKICESLVLRYESGYQHKFLQKRDVDDEIVKNIRKFGLKNVFNEKSFKVNDLTFRYPHVRDVDEVPYIYQPISFDTNRIEKINERYKDLFLNINYLKMNEKNIVFHTIVAEPRQADTQLKIQFESVVEKLSKDSKVIYYNNLEREFQKIAISA